MIFVGLALSACGDQSQVVSTCESCGYYSSDNGAKLYHWADGAQVHLRYNSSVPDDMKPAIEAATESYKSLMTTTRVIIDDDSQASPDYGSSPNNVSGDGVNGIYWVQEPWPFTDDPTASAITMLKFSDAGVIEADIFFRAKSFEAAAAGSTVQQLQSEYWKPIAHTSAAQQFLSGFAPDNSSATTQLLYVIAVHEMGHALGRVHNHNSESIMQPTIGLDFVDDPFLEYDRDMFSKVYTINPLPATVSSSSSSVSVN